jgi:rubrerythrin
MPLSEYVDLTAKAIVAALIPLGWAVILYPLMKKLRKAWTILLVMATLLSFTLFVIKEIMDKVTPVFDEIVAYMLGIFFGGAILSLFFNFKSRWLKALPKKGVIFHNLKVKKNIHLRHLLRVGILLEQRGEDFYDKLTEKATNLNVRSLCRKLAIDEVRHKHFIEKILYRWLPIPIDIHSLALFERELKKKGIFLDSPSPDASVEDLIKYAIEQEKKMADFFLSFENAFPEAWKRMDIEKLVSEERGHINKLMNLSSEFKNT